jgi:hypothetical protein
MLVNIPYVHIHLLALICSQSDIPGISDLELKVKMYKHESKGQHVNELKG